MQAVYKEINQTTATGSISASISDALDAFFSALDQDAFPSNLYDTILQQVEPPLLNKVMEYSSNNQTVAANILGISRATLRKKLTAHSLCANTDK